MWKSASVIRSSSLLSYCLSPSSFLFCVISGFISMNKIHRVHMQCSTYTVIFCTHTHRHSTHQIMTYTKKMHNLYTYKEIRNKEAEKQGKHDARTSKTCARNTDTFQTSKFILWLRKVEVEAVWKGEFVKLGDWEWWGVSEEGGGMGVEKMLGMRGERDRWENEEGLRTMGSGMRVAGGGMREGKSWTSGYMTKWARQTGESGTRTFGEGMNVWGKNVRIFQFNVISWKGDARI